MEKKSRNNIKAARVLTKNGFYYSSVSRAYYAVYLAAWHYLKAMNIHPQQKAPKGGYYWSYHKLPEILCDEYGCIGPAQMEKLELIYSRRIKADYTVDNIEKEEAQNSLSIAINFIAFFLKSLLPLGVQLIELS